MGGKDTRIGKSSHCFASTRNKVSARIMACQCCRLLPSLLSSGLMRVLSLDLSRHLTFGLQIYILQMCNIVLAVLFLSPLCTCPNHLNLFCLKNSAIGYRHVCLFPDAYISHMVYSSFFSCPPQHGHFSCVQIPLLRFPNCPAFCSVRQYRFYSLLVHILFHL